jgi:hypothetical protein
MTLKKVTRKSGGTVRERYLSALAEKSFIGLWCYPSVFRDQGLSTSGVGKEVADLLLYFDGHVVLFSDKDIAFSQHEDIKVAWGRWYRRSLLESTKQLYAAEKYIRKNGDRLFLDEKCEHPFPFDLRARKLKIHLVAVTNNSDGPARDHFDKEGKGSSGTLSCQFSMDGNDAISHPFTVPDFDKTKTFIHVFDESTLDIVLGELATTPDFIHYLVEKEKAVRERGLVLSMGEEETLATYLMQPINTGFGSLRFPKTKHNVGIMIPELRWMLYEQSRFRSIREELKRRAQLWTGLITLFSTHILDANVGEAADEPIDTHERAIRCMASENLNSRAILSDHLLEKFDSVPVGHRSSRVVSTAMKPSRAYIFVLFPRHDDEEYPAYREERTALMHAYGLVLKYRAPRFTEIIVLGMESKGSVGRSETILALNFPRPLSREEKRLAFDAMTEGDVLKDAVFSV